jgi:murein DD-endopeptidase MepM/ murein hydrolase activator NlpD
MPSRDVYVLCLLGLLLLSAVAFTAPQSTVPPAGQPNVEQPLIADFHEEPAAGPTLIWPVAGGITSYFEPSHPLGIDISLANVTNAPIRAAAAGEVIHAGGSACCGYGLYVIVDHGSGMTTRYGHLASIRVEKGQQVLQGDSLGIGGNTGASTSRHLHFEVRFDNKPVDPLPMLPSTCKGLPGIRHPEVAMDFPGGCVPLSPRH